MSYLIYLRKSRADKEAEARGEGETLRRHEQFLTELAAKKHLAVGAVYKELVSGETISARPKMQQLLLEVMQGMWEGVLVMEIERLARGDTKDQGTVAETFKFSGTRIVTPVKTFDPNNDFDEEYFEFNLFMSRREYKAINRRIQRGRTAAFQEGWYIAGTAPYGYRKVKHSGDKGFTLEPSAEEARVIRLVFDLYTLGEPQAGGACIRLGSCQICERLNALKIPGRNGGKWSPSAVIDILSNPVYAGEMRWQWRKINRAMEGGLLVQSRPRNDGCLKVRGHFPAIITLPQYELAQQIRSSHPTSGRHASNSLQNPLSGLIRCADCGAVMTRARSKTKENYPILRCPNRRCNNISAPLQLIEERLLAGLDIWLVEYELPWDSVQLNGTMDSAQNLFSLKRSAERELQRQKSLLTDQLSAVHDLLEQGVYTTEMFFERVNFLKSRIKEISKELEILQRELSEYELLLSENRQKREIRYFPKIKKIPDVYRALLDPYLKNQFLKKILDHADYRKTERNQKGQAFRPNFELILFPKLPRLHDP